jgi:hypothetical protein
MSKLRNLSRYNMLYMSKLRNLSRYNMLYMSKLHNLSRYNMLYMSKLRNLSRYNMLYMFCKSQTRQRLILRIQRGTFLLDCPSQAPLFQYTLYIACLMHSAPARNTDSYVHTHTYTHRHT